MSFFGYITSYFRGTQQNTAAAEPPQQSNVATDVAQQALQNLPQSSGQAAAEGTDLNDSFVVVIKPEEDSQTGTEPDAPPPLERVPDEPEALSDSVVVIDPSAVQEPKAEVETPPVAQGYWQKTMNVFQAATKTALNVGMASVNYVKEAASEALQSETGINLIEQFLLNFNHDHEVAVHGGQIKEAVGSDHLNTIINKEAPLIYQLILDQLKFPKDDVMKQAEELFKDKKITESDKQNLEAHLNKNEASLTYSDFTMYLFQLPINEEARLALGKALEKSDKDHNASYRNGLLSFLLKNPVKSREIIETILLRACSQLIAPAYEIWKGGDQKTPFFIYFITQIMTKYGSNFEFGGSQESDKAGNSRIGAADWEALATNPSKEQREKIWKEKITGPFVSALFNSIKDPVGLIPLNFYTAKVAGYFSEGLIKTCKEALADRLATMHDSFTVKVHDVYSAQHSGYQESLNYLKQKSGNDESYKKLLENIKTISGTVDTLLPNALKKYLVPSIAEKAAKHILANADDKEASMANMTYWMEASLIGVMDEMPSLMTGVRNILSDNLYQVFVIIVASILRNENIKSDALAIVNGDDGLTPEETKNLAEFFAAHERVTRDEFLNFINTKLAPQKFNEIKAKLEGLDKGNANNKVFDILFETFRELFEGKEKELLLFDDEVKLLPLEEREKRIQEKYAPQCKQFLKTIGLDTHPLLNEYQIAEKYLPAYMHAIFVIYQKPIALRAESINQIIMMTTNTHKKLDGVEDFKKTVEKVMSEGRSVDAMVEDIQEAAKKYLEAELKPEELREMVQNQLVESINKTADIYAQSLKIKIDSDKQLVHNMSLGLANRIKNLIKEHIGDSVDKLVGQINTEVKGTLGQELDDEALAFLKNMLTSFSKNPNSAALKTWDMLENELSGVLVKVVENVLKKAKAADDQQHNLSSLTLLMVNLLTDFGPGIELQRTTERQSFTDELQKLEAAKVQLTSDEEIKKCDEAIADLKKKHMDALGEIYKPFVESLLEKGCNISTPEAFAELLPEKMKEYAGPIWRVVFEQYLPQLLGTMHETTMTLMDQREDMRKQLRVLFKSEAPETLARRSAEAIKAYLPIYMKEELEKDPKETKEKGETLLSETIIDGIISFFSTSEAGLKAVNTLKEKRSEFVNLLNVELKDANQNTTMEGVLNVGADYIEGIILRAMLGGHETIKEKIEQNPDIIPEALHEFLVKVRAHLNSAEASDGTAQNKPKKPPVKLLDRVLKVFNIDKNNEKLIASELQNVVFEALDDHAMPLLSKLILESIANEKTLKSIILSGLEAADENYTNQTELEEKERADYLQKKEAAMRENKKIPDRKKAPPSDKQDTKTDNKNDAVKANEMEDKLTKELDLLLMELTKLPKMGRLMKRALLRDDVRQKTAKTLAKMAYDKLSGDQIIHYMSLTMGAGVRNLGIAEEVALEDGSKALKKLNIDFVDGEFCEVEIDPETDKPVMIDHGNGVKKPKILRKLSNEDKFKYQFDKTPQDKKFELDQAMEKKIEKMVKKVSLDAALGPIKRFAKNLWFNIQDALDRVFNKIPHGGQVKLFLDKVARAIFYYTIGWLIVGLAQRMKRLLENKVYNEYKAIYEKAGSIFKPNLVEDTAKEIENLLVS